MAKIKQFDKWLNKDKCPLLDFPNWNHREVCMVEEGWKAALEMVLSHRYSDTDESLYDILQRELGHE